MSSSTASDSLVSAAEVESALAQAASIGESIPSLDDATVIAVPVDMPAIPRLQPHPAASPPVVMSPIEAEPIVDIPTPVFETPNEKRSIADYLFGAIDGTLAVIDIPFRALSREAKTLIFVASAVSLAMSIGAAAVLPLLFPPPNPAAEVHQKALAALAPKPAPAEAAEGEASAPEGGGGHEPAPAHGAEAKPASSGGH